jgi:hypothetical protein
MTCDPTHETDASAGFSRGGVLFRGNVDTDLTHK